jgi:hypothetical protein
MSGKGRKWVKIRVRAPPWSVCLKILKRERINVDFGVKLEGFPAGTKVRYIMISMGKHKKEDGHLPVSPLPPQTS